MASRSGKSNADSKFIWMNGKYLPYDEARVHVLSHTLHYGTGAFEGIRAYQTHDKRTAAFRLKEHMQRFHESVKVLGLEMPESVSELCEISLELVRKNEFSECYIRPLAFLDDSIRGLKLPPQPQCSVAIAVWKWGKYLGADSQKTGIRIGVSTFRRADVASSLPGAKLTGPYITPVLARQEATRNGFDEALLLDPQGHVAEGSGENLFLVKDKKIYTPPATYILPGITRSCVIELARHLGFSVEERAITRNDLYLADELFFSGTAVEVTPIREVDYHQIGEGRPGPVATQLYELFFKIVQGENRDFAHWLTYV